MSTQGFIQHNGHFLAPEKIYNAHAKPSVCVTVCDALIWRMRRISVYEIVPLWATLLNALYVRLLVVQKEVKRSWIFLSACSKTEPSCEPTTIPVCQMT